MALSLKSFPFALGFTSLLSRISSFYPRSLSSQTSSCSLSLDSSESDRVASSLGVPPNHAVFLQIFRIDIPGMYHMDLSRDDSTRDRSMRYISGISACIESDVTRCIVARSAYRFCYRHCEVIHRWTYLGLLPPQKWRQAIWNTPWCNSECLQRIWCRRCIAQCPVPFTAKFKNAGNIWTSRKFWL